MHIIIIIIIINNNNLALSAPESDISLTISFHLIPSHTDSSSVLIR